MSKFRGFNPPHPSFLEDYPDEALRVLLNRLNRKNLKELLLFSSFISIIDYYDTMKFGYNIFAPLINVELNNLLSQAIIRSTSQLYKSETIEKEDLEFIYHKWLNITGFRKKIINNEDSLYEKNLDRQMIAMQNIQVRFQNYSVYQRETRSCILYIDIPKKHKSELKSLLKERYISIPEEFEKKLVYQFLTLLPLD